MPGPGEPRPFHAPRYVRKTLSNGLDVWVCPWRTLPIVNASLVVGAGTADDAPEKAGLAGLTAALLDKGTKDRSATELAEAFEALGTSPSVGAGVDHTTVGLSVIARNFDPALALLAPMLAGPRLDPKDFDRERRLQLAELLQGPEDPAWIALRAFRALLFGKDTPYGLPPDGYPSTVEALTLDDVRAFHRDRFGPDGSTFIVVGDVEPEAVFATLEKTLGTWSRREGRKASARAMPDAAGAEPGTAFVADKPGAVQSVVRVGRRWVDRADPRYFATLIGNRVLGADFLSRLNQNLREEHGYTYGAGSVFDYRRIGSVWLVSTSVRTDATAPALKEVLKELDDLAKKRPFTEAEIEVARAAEARSYPETFEAPSGIAGILGEMAIFELPADYLDTFLDRLQAAKADAIRAAMTELVAPEARTILVVGDRKAIEPELKALKRGPVRAVTPDGRPAR
jgi:zinc protease